MAHHHVAATWWRVWNPNLPRENFTSHHFDGRPDIIWTFPPSQYLVYWPEQITAFRETNRSKQRSESAHLNLKLMQWVCGGILWPKYSIQTNAPARTSIRLGWYLPVNLQQQAAESAPMSLTESESLNFKISHKLLSEGEYYITARAWCSEANQISFRCRIDTMRLSWLKVTTKPK